MQDFYQRENEFWVGTSGNPAYTNNNGAWKGMAHYFTAKTAIEELPFVTHFNTGSGKFFTTVDGIEWVTNHGINVVYRIFFQHGRWPAKEGGQAVNVNFDWETAYDGGSSLKLSGTIDSDHPTHIKLYKTNLPVQKDTEISVIYKTDLRTRI